VSELPISSNIHVKPVYARLIKIVIPLDTFQQHLLKTFFQPKVGEMEIDKTLIQIKFQNLHNAGWTKKTQLIKIKLGFEESVQ